MILKLNKQYKIKYRVSGKLSDTTVFLIHGLGDAITSFSNQVPFLEKYYRCVYFDLPGFGENNKMYLTFADTLNLIEDIFQKEKCDFNYILGHSMGGLIGLLLAVRKKVIVNYCFAVEPSLSLADKKFFNYIQEKPVGIGFDEFSLSRTGLKGYSKIYYENVKRCNPIVFKEFSKEIFDNFDNFSEEILKYSSEFAYIIGEKSIGLEERELLKKFPSVQTVNFQNSGHWVHIDESDKFNKLMNKKIAEQKMIRQPNI